MRFRVKAVLSDPAVFTEQQLIEVIHRCNVEPKRPWFESIYDELEKMCPRHIVGTGALKLALQQAEQQGLVVRKLNLVSKRYEYSINSKIKASVNKSADSSDEYQCFMFYENRIEASDKLSARDAWDMDSDWDYLLAREDGKETGYSSRGKDGTWRSLAKHSNPWGLKFMTPGSHKYEDYPQFKHLKYQYRGF